MRFESEASAHFCSFVLGEPSGEMSRVSVGSSMCSELSACIPTVSSASSTDLAVSQSHERSASFRKAIIRGSSGGTYILNSSWRMMLRFSISLRIGSRSGGVVQYSWMRSMRSGRYLRMWFRDIDTSFVSCWKMSSRRDSSPVRSTWKSTGITRGRYCTHASPCAWKMNTSDLTTVMWWLLSVVSLRIFMRILMATFG